MNISKNKNYNYLVIILIIISLSIGYLLGKNQNFQNNILSINNENKNINLQDFNNLLKDDKKIELTNNDLKLFIEAFKIIADKFYSYNSISKKDLVYWMIKGLTESLKDKHSEFFNIDETKKFNEALSWDFEWIWAVILKNDFWVSIERIIAWSPAKDAGLLAWDIIIKANEFELKNLTVSEAVVKIRWQAWTKVILEIIRQWEKEILKKEVIRWKINIPSVDSKIIDEKLGYIILSIYWEKTWEEFRKLLNELYSKDIKWLIIDLRDNWWWYLETAVNILSNFIEKDKVLVITKEKNPLMNKSYFSYWNNNKLLPLVILINGNSASASEITAWALKDYNLAILTWEKSYGKWSVQEPFILSDWSEMKITVAKWFTPLDHWIDWIGIKPDFEIKFQKEDYDNKYDRQLEESKKILSKFIELWDIKKTKDFFNIQKQMELKEKLDKISSWTGIVEPKK